MTIKMTVSLPDHLIHYAEKLVEEGRYPSLDSVLAAGVEDMMLNQPAPLAGAEQDEGDPVAAMADELRRRMALPQDAWIPWDGDDMIDRILRGERR